MLIFVNKGLFLAPYDQKHGVSLSQNSPPDYFAWQSQSALHLKLGCSLL